MKDETVQFASSFNLHTSSFSDPDERLHGVVAFAHAFEQLGWAILTLLAPAWQVIANGISQSGGQNVVTNPGSGSPRWLWLRYSY